MNQDGRSVTQKVANNTVWYGLEICFSIAAALLSSIPVARAFGPEKLSYYTYLQWLTNIGATLAMIGIPAMARKFMAEFMGKNQPAIVWAVFVYSLRMQLYMGLLITFIGGVLTALYVPAEYKAIAAILLLNIIFKMLVYVPSMANNAAENMKINFFGGMVSSLTTILIVNLSLHFGWGLLGVACSFPIGVGLELTIKMIMTLRWLPRHPGAKLPAELQGRMRRFSGREVVLIILNIVVWDRSDLLFLKWLDKDVKQVTFFALAFNLVEKILLLPTAFTTVVGASVMAQSGRDKKKLYEVTGLAPKYCFLISLPVMFGVAALSGPLIRLTYGERYLPVIPVLAIAAMLAAANPLLPPVQSLMQAEERQMFLIKWGLLSGAVNILLDITLIPLAGAQGAAWANGLAQVFAISGVWVAATRSFRLPIPIPSILQILLSSTVMAICAWFTVRINAPVVIQMAAGIAVGALVYFLMLALTGCLNTADVQRFQSVLKRLPGPARGPAAQALRLLAFRASGAAV